MRGIGARAHVDELRRAVSGEVIDRDSPGYDDARRVWNGMIDRRPLAVVRAATIADIAPVVRYASDSGNARGFLEGTSRRRRPNCWTRSFHAALQPSARGAEYDNFLGTEGPKADARQLAMTAYGTVKFERLAALKRRYDPTNLFRLNHNIPP